MFSVNTPLDLEREANRVLRGILGELPQLRVTSSSVRSAADPGCDGVIDAVSGKAKYRFCLVVHSRITPQIALSVCQPLGRLPRGTIPVLFAPVISPRVAEILRAQGIGYVDGAG